MGKGAEKAPATGPNQGGSGPWQWIGRGIPVGWATDGTNRHDSILFEPTLEAVGDRGPLLDVETWT